MAFLASAAARGTLGFMLAGIVVLLVIVITAIGLSLQAREYAEQVTQLRAFRTQASLMQMALLDTETSQRGFLLTQDRNYLGPYEKAKPVLAAALKQMSDLAANDPEEARAVVRLSALTERKLAEMSQTIALVEAGHTAEALDIVKSDRGKRDMDEIRSLLGDRINRIERRVNTGLAAVTSGSRALSWISTIGGLFIVIFAVGAFLIVMRYTREVVGARTELEILNTDLEQRVAERTSDLSRANDEIQRFAYIVSHDLRAPLVNIMGFTSELQVGVDALQHYVSEPQPDEALTQAAKVAVNEDIPEAVRFIRTSTTKMDGLINAILKLSRQGRREITAQMVDLKEVLATAAASVQHQLEQADGRIELAPDLPKIRSDRLAIEQIFGNLIDNAVKYFSSDRPGRIAVEAEERRGRVIISIADNGRGIAQQDQERIFELFRRAGEQNKPGEGVGLAHVRALTRRLGGDVTVESQIGQGSTFRVDLPKTLATARESSN